MAVVAARMQRLARLHLVEKFQLVIEFRIERGIGNVAAGRDVEIVQHQRLCELRLFAERHRDVTRIDLVAEGSDIGGLERQFRDDGDAVIALLPVQRDVLIAEALEALQREGVVDAFGFLQAQHVRPRRFEEFGDDVDAQAHRIDIPRCQGKPHEGRVLPRFVRTSPCLSTVQFRRVGKGALATCPPSTSTVTRWWARCAFAHPTNCPRAKARRSVRGRDVVGEIDLEEAGIDLLGRSPDYRPQSWCRSPAGRSPSIA